MKPRPIENLLKYCEKVDKQYGDYIPSTLQSKWNRNRGWVEALKYVTKTYNCTPK